MLSDDQVWRIIGKAGWTRDHDYDRIGLEFLNNLPATDCLQVFRFIQDRLDELYRRFKGDWLAHPGIPVSDDSWWDLRAEVVGRGKRFFSTITAAKLRRMAHDHDFHENFSYCRNVLTADASASSYSPKTRARVKAWLKRQDPRELPKLLGYTEALDAVIADVLKGA